MPTYGKAVYLRARLPGGTWVDLTDNHGLADVSFTDDATPIDRPTQGDSMVNPRLTVR